jgi:hypothetical protein
VSVDVDSEDCSHSSQVTKSGRIAKYLGNARTLLLSSAEYVRDRTPTACRVSSETN